MECGIRLVHKLVLHNRSVLQQKPTTNSFRVILYRHLLWVSSVLWVGNRYGASFHLLRATVVVVLPHFKATLPPAPRR
jgi:hypothetical protein